MGAYQLQVRLGGSLGEIQTAKPPELLTRKLLRMGWWG